MPASPVARLGRVAVIDLVGAIEVEAVARIAAFDRALRKESRPAALIRLASGGGDTDAGLMIHALLRTMPFRVITLALGVVDSAAAVVFSAGDQRIASPTARFLLHRSLMSPSRAMTLEQLAEVRALAESRTDEEFAAIASVTRVAPSRLREQFDRGWVLSATEARRLGFVTRIAHEVAYEERILKSPDSGSSTSEVLRI